VLSKVCLYDSECTLNRKYLIFGLMWHLILFFKYVQIEVNRNDAFMYRVI
jgi:hypothetical protein